MAYSHKTAEVLRAVQQQGIHEWKIVIIDDEPDNLDLAAKVLSWQGASVYTALNGEEGLKILKDITPTLILLDLSMPVLDGWATIERIRALPHLNDVPVIALTAHAMQTDRTRVTTAGFDGSIIKPFRISGFMGVIYETLNDILGAGAGG
ncbi:MAG: response regulator [Anaerolineae bacterium]|nr:response regulator [Anaerolineae bacterium]